MSPLSRPGTILVYAMKSPEIGAGDWGTTTFGAVETVGRLTDGLGAASLPPPRDATTAAITTKMPSAGTPSMSARRRSPRTRLTTLRQPNGAPATGDGLPDGSPS